jgi:hypothetical protein
MAVAAAGGPRELPRRIVVKSLEPDTYVEYDGKKILSEYEKVLSDNEKEKGWEQITKAASVLGVHCPQRLMEREPKFASEGLDGRNLSDVLSLLKDFVRAVAGHLTIDTVAKDTLCQKLGFSFLTKDLEDSASYWPRRIATMILTAESEDHRRVLRALLSSLPDGRAQEVL